MTHSAPLTIYRDTVQADWIDYNGHMNVAYYMLAFDRGTDALLDYIGMTADYRARQRRSVFTLEAHINYLQELKQGEPFYCTLQLLDVDAKRIHYFQHLYQTASATLAATNELILLHMDMRTRRSAAMDDTILTTLEALLAAHQSLPRPPQVGSVIGIRRKTQPPGS